MPAVLCREGEEENRGEVGRSGTGVGLETTGSGDPQLHHHPNST